MIFFGFSLSNELNISYLIAIKKTIFFIRSSKNYWLAELLFFKIEHEYFLNVLRRNLTMYVIFQPVLLGGALGKSYKFSSPPFPWRTQSTDPVIKQITVPAAIILASIMYQNDVCFKGHTTSKRSLGRLHSKGLVQLQPRLYSGWGFLTFQWDRQLKLSANAGIRISGNLTKFQLL